MLLVGHEDVAHEGTLTWQKRYGELDGLTMPILAVFSIEFDTSDRLVQLVQKAKLSSHAEI